MRTLALIAAGALALALPAAAEPQPATPPATVSAAPSRLALAASLAGGAEAGADGPAGLGELELLAGWEIPASAARAGLVIRPEFAVAFGFAPDANVALRPGVRTSLPGTPLWLRAAGDWSNARGKDPGWRWVLVGVAWEVRITSALGVSFEADTGIPLASNAGLPLLLRAGATFRP